MEGIIGVILGAIATYFFNNLNTKQSNSYNLEKEYIENVCVKISRYLATKGVNESLGRKDFEEIVKFIDDVYEKNYICITEMDNEVLHGVKQYINGDLNILIKNYTVLKEYYNKKIENYRKIISRDGKKNLQVPLFYLNVFWAVFIIVVSLVLIVAGIAGIYGVGGWRVYFYDRYLDYLLWDYGLSFTYVNEPYVFCGIGIIIGIVGIYMLQKQIRQYKKNIE